MEQKLRSLQLTQLEMLKKVDRICREHDIPYSLYAGTLLGAVRHQGFIPWDDDLDICMSRENYDKFIALWPETEHEGYLMQNKENASAFSQSFTKIRKEHTTFLQSEGENELYHTGIFIDIFPIDRIPDGKLARYLFWWDCMRYQLYTREFVPQQYGRVKKWVSAVILALVSPKRRKAERERLLKRITRNNNNRELETAAIETLGSMRKPFAKEMLDEYTEIRFEDGMFMCFAGWDNHLRRKFGDYMQLPPEEERTWKHLPLVLDFEHNYEELI